MSNAAIPVHDHRSTVRAAEPAAQTRRPLLPQCDPFFTAPTGFERLAAGTVLRSRPIEVALFGVVPQKFSAWQLLYRTCDLDGDAQTGITTVLLPDGAQPEVDRPLLSYQCAIDAVATTCFPSYALQRGAQALGSIPQVELPLIAGALARGWAVSVPDHEGPDGLMGVARQPGYHILDGIRAALTFAPLGLNSATPVGLWGYSGGGLATSWAAEMAPEYAAELNIAGVALGSPVGDPGAVFEDLNGTVFNGLPAIVVAALQRAYPEFDLAIRRHVDRKGLDLLGAIERMSTVTTVLRLTMRNMGRHTDRPVADLLALPEISKVIDEIRLGGRTPTAPLFVAQAVHDPIIRAERVDDQVRRYRAGGAHVTYRRDLLSEHFLLHTLATPVAMNWLADRFAGVALPAADTKTVWSVAFSPSALRGLAGLGWTAAKVLAGLRIRPAPAAATRRQDVAEVAA